MGKNEDVKNNDFKPIVDKVINSNQSFLLPDLLEQVKVN